MRLLQIIRWKNLVMIALVQMLIKFYLMTLFEITAVLSNWQFVLIVLASILIAAAGYVINDIYDVETDTINKPTKVWIPTYLKEKKAKLLYYLLSLLGFSLGVYVSFSLQSIQSLIWFLIPIFLLYIYAVWAKKVLILGNLLISLLVAYSLLIVVLFETNIITQSDLNFDSLEYIIFFLAVFAFIITFIREIVKDVEDIEGDKVTGVISIPIKYGIEKTKIIARNLVRIVMGLIGAIAFMQYVQQPILVGYLVLGVLASLFLFLILLRKAKTPKNFKKLSTLLKIIMLIGVLVIFMIKPL